MIQDDLIKMIEDYEKQIQNPDGNGIRADRRIAPEAMVELDTWFADRAVDPGDGFWLAANRENPDYSHYEELPNLLKDYLAEKKLNEFAFETMGSFDPKDPLVKNNLEKYSADPAFQRGVSLRMAGPDQSEQMKAFDAYRKEFEQEKAQKTPQQELNSMIADYAKQIKNPSGKGVIADRRLPAETMMRLQELLSDPSVDAGEAFRLASDRERPDFSKYGDVPGLLKDYLAEVKLQEFALTTNGSFDPSNPVVQENLEKYSMDPAFRTGVSLAKQRPESAAEMKACDSYMNMYMMEQTMKPVSAAQAEQVRAVSGDSANHILKRNEDKQVFMAKMMFLAQLGRFDQNEAGGVKKPYEDTITEALSHGGRTGFILPPGKGQTKLFDTIFGEDYYEKSGIEGRTAATHKVKQQTYKKDGSIDQPFQEKKSKGSLIKQYGMNIALGGIGQIGPNRKPIMDEGVDGHMYMNIRKGDERTSGSLLVGVENEGPGKTGRLGHAHTAAAVKSDQSAFMADKQGLGKEIGGRTIDLSHLDPNTLSKLVSDFEKGYRSMMQSAKTNERAMKELLDFNRSLCGKYMQPEDMANTMTQVGISRKDAVSALNQARGYSRGHYNDNKAHEKAYEPVNESKVQQEKKLDEAHIPPKPKFWNRVGAFFGMKKHKDICNAYREYQNHGVVSSVGELDNAEKQNIRSKRLDNMNGKPKQKNVQENTHKKGIRISLEDLDVRKENKLHLEEVKHRERSKSIYQKKSPYLKEPGKMK